MQLCTHIHVVQMNARLHCSYFLQRGRMSLQQICVMLLPGEAQNLDGEVQCLESFSASVQQDNCHHTNETHLRDGSVLNCCGRSNLNSFIALKCFFLKLLGFAADTN